MKKDSTFPVRLSPEERQRLDALARRLQRSRGDTLRFLLYLATSDPEYPHGRPDALPPLPLRIEGDWEEWGWSNQPGWEDAR